MKNLTKLGIELGKLDIEINVPENIKTLDIPAGKINLQRLFYWYFCKAFYDPNLTFDEMHHINFDWYAPKKIIGIQLKKLNNGVKIINSRLSL